VNADKRVPPCSWRSSIFALETFGGEIMMEIEGEKIID
jgi:hypothetical protein